MTITDVTQFLHIAIKVSVNTWRLLISHTSQDQIIYFITKIHFHEVNCSVLIKQEAGYRNVYHIRRKTSNVEQRPTSRITTSTGSGRHSSIGILQSSPDHWSTLLNIVQHYVPIPKHGYSFSLSAPFHYHLLLASIRYTEYK